MKTPTASFGNISPNTDLSPPLPPLLIEEEIQAVMTKLNNRSRKYLEFKTPN